jgi:hypothetical protein
VGYVWKRLEVNIFHSSIHQRPCAFDIPDNPREAPGYIVRCGKPCHHSIEFGKLGERKEFEARKPYSSWIAWSVSLFRQRNPTHLLPRFAKPVKPGPVTGSKALPVSDVREKSYFRFCSICYWMVRRMSTTTANGNLPALSYFSPSSSEFQH